MKLFRSGLTLFVMIMLTGQAIAADVKVIPSSYLATPGGTFEMNITVEPQGAAIAGAQLNIKFDQTNIRINNITEGKFLNQKGAGTFFSGGIINNSAGTVVNIFGAVMGRTNVSNPGTFIIINATAIGSSGKSGINLSHVKISNSDAQLVPSGVYNGSITINSPPLLAAIGDKKIFEGQTIRFTVSATDPNSDTLIYSASNLPAGAAFDPVTRTFSWTPGFTRSGMYQNVHFEVSDGKLSDFENIKITVNKRADIMVTPSSRSVNKGQNFKLNVSIDPMGNSITGARLSLAFDRSRLNMNSVTEGTFLKQNGASTIFNSGVIDNPSGKVNDISGAIIGPYNVTTRGTFIIINFSAIGSSGTSGVNVSNIMISDIHGDPVAFNLTNGSISINNPPVLNAVENRTVIIGQNATFSAVASGTAPLSYQWRKNGSNIPGANSMTYTTPATTSADNGTLFRVVVTNVAGSITSNAATLTIQPSPKINLIKNPGFESGTASWLFYTSAAGSFKTQSPGFEGTRAANLSLNSGGTNIQLYQTGVTVEPDTSYRLSFSAYSTTGHDIAIKLFKHVSPYTNYGLDQTFNLSKNWKTFSTEFTTKGFTGTINDGRLFFWLAPFAAARDIYYIDDIKLEKI